MALGAISWPPQLAGNFQFGKSWYKMKEYIICNIFERMKVRKAKEMEEIGTNGANEHH